MNPPVFLKENSLTGPMRKFRYGDQRSVSVSIAYYVCARFFAPTFTWKTWKGLRSSFRLSRRFRAWFSLHSRSCLHGSGLTSGFGRGLGSLRFGLWLRFRFGFGLGFGFGFGFGLASVLVWPGFGLVGFTTFSFLLAFRFFLAHQA